MKREQNPPTFPPKLLYLCCSPRFDIFAFFSETRNRCPRNNDILPASDLPFGSRLIFKKSYLAWSDYILNFNEINRETSNQKTPKFSVWTIHAEGAAQHYSILLFCFYVNDWTFSGLQPSFLIQQHEGKKMLCWINCRLKLKCKSLRVYVCISGQVTAPSNRRILSNFQIWLNRSQSFPQKILWRSKRTTYRLPKARFSVNYFV